MAIAVETPYRGMSSHSMGPSLDDRFEVIKEIGDGSFGSVALARTRTAGSHIARRGTMVPSTIQFCFLFSNMKIGRN